MCRIEDCDPWEFFHNEVRKAAKEHACVECGRTISKGETYTYSVGKMDDRMSSYKQCEHCLAAAQWLQVACGGWLFEGVLEELREHWDEEPELRSPVLMNLIRGINRKWEGGSAPVPDVEKVKASVPVAARS